jgi:hypothetical protein
LWSITSSVWPTQCGLITGFSYACPRGSELLFQMGYINFTPETFSGGKVVVSGELDKQQLEEVVRRLKVGVEGVTRFVTFL